MTKILVIDDDPNDRLIIRKILSRQPHNFEVIEAKNGQIGIKLALEYLPDLILCDVIMPNTDGYNVLKKLRSYKVSETIPFIFLTAKNDLEDLRKGMNLGADDYLLKPFQAESLIEAVQTRLKRFNSMKKYYTEELKLNKKELNNYLNYNQITNLPNRFSLQEKFDQIIQKWYKESTQIIPFITLKLIQLDEIINNHGEEFKNNLLKKIAEKLLSLIGQDNVIAQIEDDEFVIILTPVKDENIINSIVNALILELSEAFNVENQEIFIQPNIGISLYPSHGKQLKKLLKNSRIALNKIEEDDEDKYRVYSLLNQSNQEEEDILQKDLSEALDNNQLKVYYRPQFNFKTNKMSTAEALIVSNHPRLSTISENQLLAIAEKTELIESVGEWLLDSVCKDIKHLRSQGFQDINIAINLSVQQFDKVDFNKKLMKILVENNLNASYLSLEIKEDLLVTNDAITIGRLNALHDIGIVITLKDFNKGYSSLNYLQSFPIDTIKVNRLLTKDIDKSEDKLDLVKNTISLAHKLNFSVVAEGVKTEEELDCLKNINCDVIQGLFLSQTVPLSELAEVFKTYESDS